ncbi:MAG: hypothetical protein RLZZ393_508 [Pseudomonadota bacterium]|jgi:uncharacterized protein YbaP (TraB family)
MMSKAWHRALCAGLAVMLLWVAASPALPAAETDAGWHTFWSVKGRHGNTLWLLGSVHLLRPEDASPPPNVLEAYRASKQLVLELQVDGAGGMGPPDARLLKLPPGRSLRAELGTPLYERFTATAASQGLPTTLLDPLQPWFAAITYEQTLYAKLGLDAAQGVDVQFARRAAADGKPVIGLETLNEQLGFFASLSMKDQVELLRETLDETADIEKELGEIITAWRRGDVARLESLLAKGRTDSPVLMQRLTTDRNRKWMKKLLPLLEGQQDALVIVGALHLAGPDGLPNLLRKAGWQPVQR